MNQKRSKSLGGLCKMMLTGWVVAMMTGCSTGKIEHHFENMIYVNQRSLQLYYGDTQQLTASPTENTFEWSSDDPQVATVDNEGWVKATGVGFTQIVVRQGEWTKTIDVEVSLPTLKTALARAGNKRVLIEVDIDNDHVQELHIMCKENNRAVRQEVGCRKGTFQFYYNDLPEGKYNFAVICVDGFGNEATPVNVTGNVYGDTFQASLTNRAVEVATCFGNGLIIKWKAADGDCLLTYKNENGEAVEAKVPASEANTYLEDFASDLSYATFAIPENNAADTFYVAPVALTFEDLRPVLTHSEVCTIAITDFDLGGEGVAFHDTTKGNSGGSSYRKDKGDPADEGVDIESGLNIGYTDAGEWQQFTLHVKEAGWYAFDLRRSVNNSQGGYYSLEVDGQPTHSVYMKNDGDWGAHKWQHETYPDSEQPRFYLTEGRHTLRFVVGPGGNFNYTHLRLSSVEDGGNVMNGNLIKNHI